MSNTIQRKPSFSAMLQTPAYQQAITNALTDKKEIQKFTAAITSVVATNPAIAECESSTILSSALLGHSLGLVPSPQLGQYYFVPFKDRRNGRTTATFVIGYKGYVQLAVRSGMYKNLNVLEVKEGELKMFNRLTEEYEFEWIDDDTKREATPTIGYVAYFEYITGFHKMLYWTKDKMKAHALRYSQGYKSDVNKGTNYTFWSKDFDGMAKKTMLRQLISKWGTMSADLQTAYISDGATISNELQPMEYTDQLPMVDTEPMPEPQQEELAPQPVPNPTPTPTPTASKKQQFSLADFD